PLSPQAICRAARTPEAQTSILKPCGSLIFLMRAASSASDAPVGGPDGGARPFCASFSSPRNQSSGGWVQNSLVPVSYFLSARCIETKNFHACFAGTNLRRCCTALINWSERLLN